MAEDTTFCGNCKKNIPSVNFVMHSMHCARNITLCIICEEPVPRSEMDAHQVEFHSDKDCELCGEKVDVSLLKEHKEKSCSMRRVTCAICELDLVVSEINDHENYCGSRTERCEECGEYVMLKYQKLHLESNHTFLKLDDEPGPTPSWQSNERVPVNGAFNNDLRTPWKAPPDFSSLAAFRLPNFVSPSTSKRTNDMPQVNSIPPPHASKSLHKPLLMGGRDKPSWDYDNLDSDVAALISDSLHLTKPPTHPRPLSSPGPGLGDDDLVALPCEFCEALVPANQLIIHQTACRPDLARYEVPGAASNPLIPPPSATTSTYHHPSIHSERMNPIALGKKIHNNFSSAALSSLPAVQFSPRKDFSSSAMDDAMLPCEFCNKSYSVSKLYEHQTQCNQTWPDGFNGRPEMSYSFNGQSEMNAAAHLSALHKRPVEYKAKVRDTDRGAPKATIHNEEVKGNGGMRHCRLPNADAKGEQKRTRDWRRHMGEKDWVLPVQPRSGMRPSALPPKSDGLRDLEGDEGRQALLKQAQMMDQINAQLGLKKESSNSFSRNHVYSELPSYTPRPRKQPNHFTNPPSSSHNTGSFTSSASNYSQSGRGGGRTTGAIPKQKAGTSKSSITY